MIRAAPAHVACRYCAACSQVFGPRLSEPGSPQCAPLFLHTVLKRPESTNLYNASGCISAKRALLMQKTAIHIVLQPAQIFLAQGHMCFNKTVGLPKDIRGISYFDLEVFGNSSYSAPTALLALLPFLRTWHEATCQRQDSWEVADD